MTNEYLDKVAESIGPRALPGVHVVGPRPAMAGAEGLGPNFHLHRHYTPVAWGPLQHLAPATRLAVEMAVNEDAERGAMEGELELLEMAWRDAEEIASVADDLLVPQETAEHLARLRAENANHTAQEVQPHASQLR